MGSLRLLHGRLLAREEHHEETAEDLLRAGALDEARASAERAIAAVVERVDFAIAERWLATLADATPTDPAADYRRAKQRDTQTPMSSTAATRSSRPCSPT